jgi:hypothetical protein
MAVLFMAFLLYVFLHPTTFTKAERLSNCVPVNPWLLRVPAGVKFTVELVPAGVSVWECVPNALPVKVGALTEPAGVPALTACESATAAEVVLAVPAALTAVAARDVPVPNVATAICLIVVVVGICHGNSCACVASALPVKVGTEFVPAGVPAETAEVAWLGEPVKVCAGTTPDVPVNVACATVPAGVMLSAPPVVPTCRRLRRACR